jgi:predicted nuclease of predicted toxin-antitoxin system
MKLLIDMNLSPRWVGVLATSGFEAAHWSTLGAGDASDVAIMSYARTHGHVVLTHDLDFSAILAATNGDKPSVVQIRADDVSPDAIGEQVTRVSSTDEARARGWCAADDRPNPHALACVTA